MVKRAEDILIASVALLLLSPLMLIIALLVRLTSPGPALFRQERIGLNGRSFTMLKFRTMHHKAAPVSRACARRPASDPRVTRFGAMAAAHFAR